MSYLDEVADFIFVNDPPERADVIIIAGSPRREPVLRAAALFREGYAPLVMPTGRFGHRFVGFHEEIVRTAANDGISAAEAYAALPGEGVPRTECEFEARLLLEEGVPETAILREDRSVNTFENANFARQLLEERDAVPKRMLLCCQAFHARRAMMTFATAFPDTEILVCPAVTRGISKETWLTSAERYDKVFDELEKCGAYFRGERMYAALK